LTPDLLFSKSKQKGEINMAKDIRKTIRFSKDEFAQIQEKLNEAQISFSE